MTTQEIRRKCTRCDGSGFYAVPSGEDDFDLEYCRCPVGKNLINRRRNL